MSRKVLCAEDDPDDKEFICEALTKIDPEIEIVHAENGKKAIDTMADLNSCNELPCLIIIDVNMPLIDGRELVKQLKQNPVFQTIPIAIFTTSQSPTDVKFFATFGVNVYVKPNNMRDIDIVVEKMLALCV